MGYSVRRHVLTLLPLIVFLVCSLIVIKTERTQASLTQQTVPVPGKRPPNERKLIKSTWRNEPLTVSKVKVKKGAIQLGRKFTDDSDDWLDGLTLTVKNTSFKDILGVDVSLTLFTKEGGDKVDDVPIQFPFSYGSDQAIVEDDSSEKPIKPGHSVDIKLSEDAYLMLKEGLARANYPRKFQHVELRIDAVLFADGTLWRKGYIFVRDPNDPTKWIRDKYLAEAKAQKENKDAATADLVSAELNKSLTLNSFSSPTTQLVGTVLSVPVFSIGGLEPLGSIATPGPMPTPTPPVQDCTGTACVRPPGCYELDSWDNVPCNAQNANCTLEDDEVQGVGEGKLRVQRLFCRLGSIISGSICDPNASCTCEFYIDVSCTIPIEPEGCQNFGWYWNFQSSGCYQEQQSCGAHCNPYWPLESGGCESPVDYCAFQYGCGFGLTDGGSGCCCGPTPVVIDVAGNGFALTDAYTGVNFDMGGDGHREPIAWTTSGSDDAWLVLDRNGNGQIDSSKEMFGNFTDQPQANTAPNGFLALAHFDRSGNGGNEDRQIDSRDSIFNNLRLWQDKNHNGVSEANELNTLSSFNVGSLDLDFKESKKTDEHGNRFGFRTKVKNSQGQHLGRWAWDVILTVNPPPQ